MGPRDVGPTQAQLEKKLTGTFSHHGDRGVCLVLPRGEQNHPSSRPLFIPSRLGVQSRPPWGLKLASLLSPLHVTVTVTFLREGTPGMEEHIQDGATVGKRESSLARDIYG
jgi:hypothetical protein